MDYFGLVNNAIDYIDSHIEERLLVDDVIKSVFISKFHFLRIYKALTGYTLKEYIELRKLDLVVKKIITTTESILDIAISTGFNSHEVLTRRFKKIYGMTPSEFRAGNIMLEPFDKVRPIKRAFLNKQSKIYVRFEIMHFGNRYVIGEVKKNKRSNTEDISLRDFLFPFADRMFINYPDGNLYLATLSLDRNTSRINYFVGFDDYGKENSYDSYCIKSSTYAIFQYKGVFMDNINLIVDDVYKSIISSDLLFNDIGIDMIEVYDRHYLHTGDFEIHVPIK